MKKFFLFCIVFFAFVLHAGVSSKQHIFVLHSYSHEYQWTKSQQQSFVSTLKHSLAVAPDISVEYLDTKRIQYDEQYQTFFLEYLRHKYQDYTPDAIYVTDDNALNFFLTYKEELFHDAPLFFSGVNNMALVPLLDSKGIKGVYERKEIRPNIELIRQFSPQTRDIWIVGDTSTTYRAIESDMLNNLSNYPNHTFHFLSYKKIDDVIKSLPKNPRTFVLLTTIGEWEDQDGHVLSINESISLLRKRPELIICSMEDAYISGGVIGGYVTSGLEQGTAAAKMIVQYLEKGDSDKIESVTKSPNVYMFDRKALVKSRIILSEYTARNAVILHEDESLYSTYHDIIINVIFVISIISIVFLIIVFFLFLDKKRRFNDLEKELHMLQLRNHDLHTIMSAIEKDCLAGYWEWNRETYTCDFSTGFRKIFMIDSGVEKSINALMQRIYPSDKERLEEAIDDALSNSKPVTIEHRIICDDGTVKKVKQVIQPLGLASQENSNIVVGIVHDEEA